MPCPKCRKGNIRVMLNETCTCGHHTLFCDACFQEFEVPCGEPFGPGALPPEIQMTATDSLKKGLAKQMGSAPYEDFMREYMEEAPENFPLLEDFKKSLATENAP